MRRFVLVLTAVASLLPAPAAFAGPQDFAQIQDFYRPPVPGYSPAPFELVGGNTNPGGNAVDAGAVARVSENGDLLGEALLDATPGADDVEAIEVADGDIFVLVRSADGNFEIYSLNTDLTTDPQCAGDGEAEIDLGGDEQAFAMAVHGGKVYVAGQKDGQAFVARFNHDCSIDRSFNGTGVRTFDLDPAAPDQFNALEIDDAGNLILGGVSGGQAVVAKANASGAPVAGFGTGGVVTIDASALGDGIRAVFEDGGRVGFAGFAGQDSLYGLLAPTGAPVWPPRVVDIGGIDFFNGIAPATAHRFWTAGTTIVDGRPRGSVVVFDPLTGQPFPGFNGGNPLIVDEVRTGINDLLGGSDGSAFAVGFRDNPLTQSFDFVKFHVKETGLVNFGPAPFALFDFAGAAGPAAGAAEDQKPTDLGKRLGSTTFGNNAYRTSFGAFSEPTRVVVVPEVIGDEAHGSAKKKQKKKQKVFVLAAKDYVAKPGRKKTLKFSLGKDTRKYLRSERGKRVTVKLSITTVDVIGNRKTFNRTKRVRIPRRLHF